MKHPALWRVSVTTTPAAEDSVSALLLDCFGQGAASYTNVETGMTRVSVWVPRRPDAAGENLRMLRAGIGLLRKTGLGVDPETITVTRVAAQDWAESWKRHFKVLEIGKALMIKPPWIKRRPKRGQGLLVLDPGLSFGTGQHPTTEFCLREIVRWRDPRLRQSFLDIGTGTGILALAAARMGYHPVRAFDHDPGAVRNARANARVNGLARAVRLGRRDVRELPAKPRKTYSLVCANLISDLLVDEIGAISAQVAPEGRLVLAGILRKEFDSVREACRKQGLRLVASRAVREWRSGTFAWQTPRAAGLPESFR